MFKKLLLMFLGIVLLMGCEARREIKPQRNPEEVWVCQEIDDTYFYWDENIGGFIGALTYGESSYDFVLGGDYGLGVDFLHTSVIEKKSVTEDDCFIRGFADYQKNLMPLEIVEDKLDIFGGEIDTLTFVPQDREEYFANTE